MDKKYRPLLPSAEPPIPEALNQSSSGTISKRKRQHLTRVACNACRTKKLACNSARPICAQCVTRVSECVYISVNESETPTMVLKRENETLRKNSEALEELVNHLKFMPEDIANIILQKLRNTSDPTSVIPSIRDEILSGQPLEQTSVAGILPSVHSETEFELMVRYPMTYPTFDPKSEVNLALSNSLLKPTGVSEIDNSPIRESYDGDPLRQSDSPSRQTDSPSGPERSDPGVGTNVLTDGVGSITVDATPRSPSQSISGPQPVIKYSDQRLSRLNIAFWTTVLVTDEYAMGAISLYLETDHPILNFFISHLFIGDLIDCKLEYCSPFLVASLLAFASQGYASKDPEASVRSYEFEQEAERLWCAERTSDSLSTISGLLLLFLSLQCHGKNDIAGKYIKEVTEIAMRKKLFGVADALSSKDIDTLSKQDQKAMAHAAWSAFNLIIMQSLFYLVSPIDYPPALPIPGSPKETKINRSKTTQSLLLGEKEHTFSSFCGLWTIVSEVLFIYRYKTGPQIASPAFALSKYYKLLSCADNLSSCMSRKELSPSYVLVFHIWYHIVVLDIFRLFLPNKQHDLSAWSSTAKSPEAIYAASLKQLKRLVLLYRARHPSASYSVFWHPALMYVANAALKDISDPEWRFYFLLCIHGYQDLTPSFQFMASVIRGLLAMAVGSGAITALEAQRIAHDIPGKENYQNAMECTQLGFMLDLDLAVTGSDDAKADTLVRKFEEITIFNELTDGIV